ncbi:MAG: glycosyltransferase [Deltaproteobacteria bacterium]|nr:MAG: glycosyltransferase [Deltaproteobacteria bacterium]
MPLVSFVIPTYNCAPYLTESLESILAQTFRDFEVVVVDDGSTDHTWTVLARYSDHATIVRAPHGGLSAARNAGLSAARGEWIAFHDADDVALPDRLAFQVEFLRGQSTYDAVFCNGERMADPGAEPRPVVPPAIARRWAGRRVGAAALFQGYPVYFQGALVPRRAFDAAGEFDTSLRVQPDIEYGYRLFAGCAATFVDRVVFRYRWHATNNSSDRLGGRVDIARILERLLAQDGEAARTIGRRRLRARLARHYYRIARQRAALGDVPEARAAIRQATALRPLDPRYQLLRLWAGA